MLITLNPEKKSGVSGDVRISCITVRELMLLMTEM